MTEKLRTKGRRRFSQAKRRPKQGIHAVGVDCRQRGEAELLTVPHFLVLRIRWDNACSTQNIDTVM